MVTTRSSNKRAAPNPVTSEEDAEAKRHRIGTIDGQQAGAASAGAESSAVATGMRARFKLAGVGAAADAHAGLAAVAAAAAAAAPSGGRPKSRMNHMLVAGEFKLMEEENGTDDTDVADLAALAAVAVSGYGKRPTNRMKGVLVAAELELMDESTDTGAGHRGPGTNRPASTRSSARTTRKPRATQHVAMGAVGAKKPPSKRPQPRATGTPQKKRPATGALGKNKPASKRPRKQTTRAPEKMLHPATGAVLPLERESNHPSTRPLPRVPAFQDDQAGTSPLPFVPAFRHGLQAGTFPPPLVPAFQHGLQADTEWHRKQSVAAALAILRKGVGDEQGATGVEDGGDGDVNGDVEIVETPTISKPLAEFLERQRVVWAEQKVKARRDRALFEAAVEVPGGEAHARLERDLRAAGASEEDILADKEGLDIRFQEWHKAQFVAACGGRETPPKFTEGVVQGAQGVDGGDAPSAGVADSGAGEIGPLGGLFGTEDDGSGGNTGQGLDASSTGTTEEDMSDISPDKVRCEPSRSLSPPSNDPAGEDKYDSKGKGKGKKRRRSDDDDDDDDDEEDGSEGRGKKVKRARQ